MFPPDAVLLRLSLRSMSLLWKPPHTHTTVYIQTNAASVCERVRANKAKNRQKEHANTDACMYVQLPRKSTCCLASHARRRQRLRSVHAISVLCIPRGNGRHGHTNASPPPPQSKDRAQGSPRIFHSYSGWTSRSGGSVRIVFALLILPLHRTAAVSRLREPFPL